MSNPQDAEGNSTGPGVDPVELLRKMLAIAPEDAASVREDAARAAGQRKDEGPEADRPTAQ